jgi:hypothetical protein
VFLWLAALPAAVAVLLVHEDGACPRAPSHT